VRPLVHGMGFRYRLHRKICPAPPTSFLVTAEKDRGKPGATQRFLFQRSQKMRNSLPVTCPCGDPCLLLNGSRSDFGGTGACFLVHLYGHVSIGRPIEKAGAHVAGHNAASIGVSYVGGAGADGRTPRTPELQSRRPLCVSCSPIS